MIGEYIKYKLNSKGKYDIHSPFVFDFVSECLKLPIDQKHQNTIAKLKNDLRKDQRKIQIRDFGAGSKKLGNIRSVSQIFKNAASKGVYAGLLYRLTRHYPVKNALELGTSLGLGTLHLALGNSETRVTSVDACLETQNIAQEKNNLPNITFVNSDFESYIKTLSTEKFDLIFIDGHHDGKALLNYLELLADFSHDDTLFLLDDIRWSEDMFKAWNQLVQDKNYHLTMDLFRMGIVLKRPQQAKEHFVIKLKGVLRGMI